MSRTVNAVVLAVFLLPAAKSLVAQTTCGTVNYVSTTGLATPPVKIDQLIGDLDRQFTPPTPTLNQTETRFGLSGTDEGFPFVHGNRVFLFFGDGNPTTASLASGTLATRVYNADPAAVAHFDPTDPHFNPTLLTKGLPVDFLKASDGFWLPVTLDGQPLLVGKLPGASLSHGNDIYTTFDSGNYPVPEIGVAHDDGSAASEAAFTHAGLMPPKFGGGFKHVPTASVRGLGQPWPGDTVLMTGGFPPASGCAPAGTPIYMAAAPYDDFTNTATWRYFAGGPSGDPVWSSKNADATPLFTPDPGAQCSGHSITWLPGLNKWLLLDTCPRTGFLPGTNHQILYRVADDFLGPWSGQFIFWDGVTDGAFCHYMHDPMGASGTGCDSDYTTYDDPVTGKPGPWGPKVKGNPYSPLPVPGTVRWDAKNGVASFLMLLSAWNPYTPMVLKAQLTSADAAATGGPAIARIQNNYSYILHNFPNYGIAPGALFIVAGTGLANTASAILQSSASPGLPLSLNGASISVTVNGVTTHPGLYYATSTQIAAVLPSNTPVGTGTLTVTYNGTASSPATIQVVASALGLDTYYGSGTGLGVATDATTGALINYSNPASPGQIVTLWGSGLGADPADSDTLFTNTPHGINVPLQIVIGGIPARIGYQGSSGYPGLNQINVTIPASVPAGCQVSMVAVSGSMVSNTVTLPVASAGGVCSDSGFAENGARIASLSGQSAVKEARLLVLQTTSPGDAAGSTQVTTVASAGLESVSGAAYGAGTPLPSVGSCVVSQAVLSNLPTPSTGLDAGTITVTGPSGAVTLASSADAPESYNAPLPAQTSAAFTFKSTGGKDAGAFTAAASFPAPALSWTNASAAGAIQRSKGLLVTWAGGAAGSNVVIAGKSSGMILDEVTTASYTCVAPANAGQFTVPSQALLGLPAGRGTTTVENTSAAQTFAATGLDSGIVSAAIAFSVNSAFD